MANVMFKKGLLANMPSTYVEGTTYFCTDERAIYLDISNSERVRFGDFQEFATLALLKANANPSTTALYYVTSLNCLAKWNGVDYVQINLDTGMTSVEVIGTGNALTNPVYDAETRKLTFTAVTYATPAEVEDAIEAKAGDLTYDGSTYETVKEYVDAKTSGIATDAALSDLRGRVTAAEGEIDALQEQVGDGTVSEQIDAKITALDLANTYDAKGAANTALEAAKEYADSKDEVIAAAKKAGDDAQADVDTLAETVGTVTEGKTVVQMIEEAQAAATYDDTQVKADIAANTKAVEDEAARAAAAEKANADAIAAVKEDVDAFLASAEVGEAAVDTLKEIQEYINSDGEAAAAMTKNISDNAAAIAAETERATGAEEALAGRVTTLEGDSHTHSNKDVLDGISAGDIANWNGAQAAAETTAAAALAAAKSELEGKITAEAERAAGVEESLAGRVSALEAIDHNAYISADEAVLSEAKSYADGLNSTMNGRVQALEAIDHEAYKAYADQAETDAVATAKAYSDSLVLTWGSF